MKTTRGSGTPDIFLQLNGVLQKGLNSYRLRANHQCVTRLES